MDNLPIVPGRGFLSKTSNQLRKDFLEAHGYCIDKVANTSIDEDEIRNNIESFIGTVEVPVGLVGPLLFEKELVYCGAGTLEGALVASMNRGARAISKSGGFKASVKHQRMMRAPLFIFDQKRDALRFQKWSIGNFAEIKKEAEKHSNHAVLLSIKPEVTGNSVHLKFIYTTADASGQNMTTTCTWRSVLFLAEKFTRDTGRPIKNFVIEGNGASDKKISKYSMSHGRGFNVTAECYLKEEDINRVLRTSSDKIIQCFKPSRELARKDGMIGYNINVANTVAAIFVATGQDLGSIHESGVGHFEVKRTKEGLHLKLNLPNLVIGTIGGGTHLPKQNEILRLMKCNGKGKAERFAKLIAGFAMSLEISTYSAIVSGEFAKAHEKLGRNKPVKWLLRSELTSDFVKGMLQHNVEHPKDLQVNETELMDNGIVTTITKTVTRKLIGFVPVTVTDPGSKRTQKILLKSKALDTEVVNGFYKMAASIDPELSDLIVKYKKNLEYMNSHTKEIDAYEALNEIKFKGMPLYYGNYSDAKREIYLIAHEYLAPEGIRMINSENKPELWTKEIVLDAIHKISDVHLFFSKKSNVSQVRNVTAFKPWKSTELYKKFVAILKKQAVTKKEIGIYEKLEGYLEELERLNKQLNIFRTIIHNDFNPRNIAVRTDGSVCIYDWELLMLDIPHRDISELLSFVLPEDFTKDELTFYLKEHFNYVRSRTEHKLMWTDWKKGYEYSLKAYLVTRVVFYEAANIVIKLKFSRRILLRAIKMLEVLRAIE